MAYDDDDALERQANRVCKVYDNDDVFTVFVQLFLALAALLSLWIKREYEHPKRRFITWFLDVSKQGFGACYAHVMNMFIASIIIHNIRGEIVLEDQCAWYAMCYLIDTTLGLVLAIWGLKILDDLAQKYDWTSLKHSGVYEHSGRVYWDHWILQVFAWLVIQTVVKLIIYLFMVAASSPLAYAAGIIFAPLELNIRFELVFVMILFPGVLNVVYFWIADSYLQAGADETDAHEEDPNETQLTEKKESLLTDDDKKEAASSTAEGGSSYDPKSWTNTDGPSQGGQVQTSMV